MFYHKGENICNWRILSKAGKPGWAALIPFYNNYTWFSMLYGNGWWFLACLITFVGIVVFIISVIDLAKAFSNFYNDNKILVEDKDVQNARVYLTYAVGKVLKIGANLLGIEMPDKM